MAGRKGLFVTVGFFPLPFEGKGGAFAYCEDGATQTRAPDV